MCNCCKKVKEVEVVGQKSLGKQEVLVADSSDTATMVFWGDKVGCVTEQQSYQFSRIQVYYNTYAGRYQLQYPRAGASMSPIDPLDSIVDVQEDVSCDNKVQAVEVFGVQDLDVVYTCVACKCNIPQSGSASMGICHKCNTGQRFVDPRITAKLLLRNSTGRITLRGYTPALKAIINCDNESDEVTIAKLLCAPPFDVQYNSFHVITAVTRQ